MRFGFRAATGAAVSLALLVGVPAAADPRGYDGGGFHSGGGFGYHGGGWGGGYRGGGWGGGWGGYYGGFGFGVGDALLGAAIIGVTAAIIASNDRPVYDSYPAYRTYPPTYAPPVEYGYAAPSETVYASPDPVGQCSRAAATEAARRGDNGRVLSIHQVTAHENGARVSVTLEIRRGDRDAERARFICTADYGQVTSFRFG